MKFKVTNTSPNPKPEVKAILGTREILTIDELLNLVKQTDNAIIIAGNDKIGWNLEVYDDYRE